MKQLVGITVGVGKHNGEKRMTLELKIFNLNAYKYHICRGKKCLY